MYENSSTLSTLLLPSARFLPHRCRIDNNRQCHHTQTHPSILVHSPIFAIMQDSAAYIRIALSHRVLTYGINDNLTFSTTSKYFIAGIIFTLRPSILSGRISLLFLSIIHTTSIFLRVRESSVLASQVLITGVASWLR